MNILRSEQQSQPPYYLCAFYEECRARAISASLNTMTNRARTLLTEGWPWVEITDANGRVVFAVGKRQ